jgi:hypothetical protein
VRNHFCIKHHNIVFKKMASFGPKTICQKILAIDPQSRKSIQINKTIFNKKENVNFFNSRSSSSWGAREGRGWRSTPSASCKIGEETPSFLLPSFDAAQRCRKPSARLSKCRRLLTVSNLLDPFLTASPQGLGYSPLVLGRSCVVVGFARSGYERLINDAFLNCH